MTEENYNYAKPSDPYIVLSPRDNEHLDILQEECAEVIQIVSKIRRFGLYSQNPYSLSDKHNRQMLVDEIGDVYAMILKLEERGIVSREEIEARANYKHEKLKRYLKSPEDVRLVEVRNPVNSLDKNHPAVKTKFDQYGEWKEHPAANHSMHDDDEY